MASNSKDDGRPSPLEIIEALWNIFERKVKEENITEIKGYFISTVFMLCLDFGIIAALSMPLVANGILQAGILVIFITALALIPVLPLFIWIIIPLYKSLHQDTKVMITILAYQSATIFIAIVIASIFSSVAIAFSGIVIFGIVAFVYPFIRLIKSNSSTVEDINSRLGLTLKIITLLSAIIQLIIGFAHLL